MALCNVLGRRPGPGDAAGRRKLHLRFSLGTGLDVGVVVVPESGSTSAVSRLVGQDEQDLAGAFMWDYAMALLMRESFTDEGVVAAVQ